MDYGCMHEEGGTPTNKKKKSPPALQFWSLDLTRGTNTFRASNDMDAGVEGRCRVVNAGVFSRASPKVTKTMGCQFK